MDYIYEGTIEKVDDDWLVTVPQLEGAFGGGHTLHQACENAAEALRLAIAQYISEGEPLPHASFHNPPGVVLVVQVDEPYIEGTEV